MWTTIYSLLMINAIMTMIHESGFIMYVDDWINEKYKFHHLPYPIRCLLCGTWWLSLLYIIITGQLSLLMIVFCLLNAHLTQITQPLFRFVMNAMKKLIELMTRIVS